jgi:hypothetical protein
MMQGWEGLCDRHATVQPAVATLRAYLPAARPFAGSAGEALLLAALAGALAAALCWAAPAGTDFAAHEYQRAVFMDRGFELWNNLWYSGHYSFVTYSVLYYPLAALLGIKLLAVVTVMVGTFAFATVLRREWGPAARASSAAFALVWGAFVLTGAFPFALGMALALLALSALQSGSRVLFAFWCALCLAASPLAFLLLSLVLGGIAVSGRVQSRGALLPGITVAALGALEVVLLRLFPSGGRASFSVEELIFSLGFCAAIVLMTWRVERARVLRFAFLALGVACIAAFIVPSALGHNIDRFRLVSIPVAVLALSLRRWRPLALSAVVLPLVIWWNAYPLVNSLKHGIGDEAAQASYWEPAVQFLKTNLTPSYRVEVVGTARHWEAVHLPEAGIPLTRGWFRQDDFPHNEPLYGELSAPRYLDWLRSLGVRYVVLTSSTPDYSAKREAALIESGRSGLRPVLRTPDVTVLSVPAPRRLVTGPAPARVVRLSESGLLLHLGAQGTYRVAVRYSPYWQASSGCVQRSRDGMTLVRTPGAGRVALGFEVDAKRALDVLGGRGGSACS